MIPCQFPPQYCFAVTLQGLESPPPTANRSVTINHQRQFSKSYRRYLIDTLFSPQILVSTIHRSPKPSRRNRQDRNQKREHRRQPRRRLRSLLHSSGNSCSSYLRAPREFGEKLLQVLFVFHVSSKEVSRRV